MSIVGTLSQKYQYDKMQEILEYQTNYGKGE